MRSFESIKFIFYLCNPSPDAGRRKGRHAKGVAGRVGIEVGRGWDRGGWAGGGGSPVVVRRRG